MKEYNRVKNPATMQEVHEHSTVALANMEDSIAEQFAHHKPGVARLNNGSFGSCPQSVLAAQAAWSHLWLTQPDEFYFGPLEEGLHAARAAIAHLIHAPVEEVVLVENVTAAASLVALDVMWAFVEGRYNKGDSILMLNFTYESVKKAFKVNAYTTPMNALILCIGSTQEYVMDFAGTANQPPG